MKKLINDPRRVVREMLEGLCDLHAGLALHPQHDLVVRADQPPAAQRPVALVSGGGAGHEPAHAGYVGQGLLTAAVAGDVFTSPGVDAVLAAIHAAAGPAGALLIVKNYTGDRLNFGLAAELARSQGIPVETVIVADDAALAGTVPREQRRGIAGTVLVHKVAGAAAAAGRPLGEVARAARAAAAALASMGVGLGPCTVPAVGRPGFELAEREIELGLGIHGEAGVERVALRPADALVDRLLDTILGELQAVAGEHFALLINGLGGTPELELAIVARAAMAALRRRGLIVDRAWSGPFLTALEMPGCSLSLLRLDEDRRALLDAPASAPAWRPGSRIGPRRQVASPDSEGAQAAVRSAPAGPVDRALRAAVLHAAATLEAEEALLTDLDARAGDGDLGLSLTRGARALRSLPDEAWSDPPTALTFMAQALRRSVGGSSGPFYATALLRAAAALPRAPGAGDWANALRAGAQAIAELGGAQAGDCTMLDALLPAADAFAAALADGGSPVAALQAAAAAAEAGSAATAGMRARLGRAAYLGERSVGIADGGATAVAIWLRAVARSLTG